MPSQMTPEHVFSFIALTFVFLLVAWLLALRARPLGANLIWWGILVVILSCGYAMIGVPSMMTVTPALTRIGFLLVLGGVAWSLLASSPKQSANKETNHV
jgi:heme A synthase